MLLSSQEFREDLTRGLRQCLENSKSCITINTNICNLFVKGHQTKKQTERFRSILSTGDDILSRMSLDLVSEDDEIHD